MDILYNYTQADPDATNPLTGQDMLGALREESLRTARIVSRAALSEHTDDELAQDALFQFSEFAFYVANICEEAKKRFTANSSPKAVA